MRRHKPSDGSRARAAARGSAVRFAPRAAHVRLSFDGRRRRISPVPSATADYWTEKPFATRCASRRPSQRLRRRDRVSSFELSPHSGAHQADGADASAQASAGRVLSSCFPSRGRGAGAMLDSLAVLVSTSASILARRSCTDARPAASRSRGSLRLHADLLETWGDVPVAFGGLARLANGSAAGAAVGTGRAPAPLFHRRRGFASTFAARPTAASSTSRYSLAHHTRITFEHRAVIPREQITLRSGRRAREPSRSRERDGPGVRRRGREGAGEGQAGVPLHRGKASQLRRNGERILEAGVSRSTARH